MIYKATKEFSEKSCITWIPRDPARHSDFVHIMKDRGCYSKVGRIRGAQVLSLGERCISYGKDPGFGPNNQNSLKNSQNSSQIFRLLKIAYQYFCMRFYEKVSENIFRVLIS